MSEDAGGYHQPHREQPRHLRSPFSNHNASVCSRYRSASFFCDFTISVAVSPAPLGQTALCCVATVLPDFVFRRVSQSFTASVRFAIAEDKVYAMKERISQSFFCAWRRTAIFAFARCREHIQSFPRRIPTASCPFCSETLCHLYLNMKSLIVSLALLVYHLSVVSASLSLLKNSATAFFPTISFETIHSLL